MINRINNLMNEWNLLHVPAGLSVLLLKHDPNRFIRCSSFLFYASCVHLPLTLFISPWQMGVQSESKASRCWVQATWWSQTSVWNTQASTSVQPTNPEHVCVEQLRVIWWCRVSGVIQPPHPTAGHMTDSAHFRGEHFKNGPHQGDDSWQLLTAESGRKANWRW